MSIVQTDYKLWGTDKPWVRYEISLASDIALLPTTTIAAGSLAYTPMGTRYKLSAANVWVFDSGMDGGALDNAGTLKHTVTITEGDNTSLAVTVGGSGIATDSKQVSGTACVVTFSGDTGYNAACTINGASFSTSGSTYNVPVGFDVDIVTVGTIKTYALTLTEGDNTTLTATSGSGETLVTYANGDIITHGTELTITATAADGYTLSTFTIGGEAATSPATHTMTAAATVVTAATET